jgi:hypothetical protein
MANEEQTPQEYNLTDAEKQAIDNEWDKGESDIRAIVKKVCGARYGLRDPQGMAVRKHISNRKKITHPEIEASALTKAQKEFIDKHIMMRPLEIARLLFDDEKLQYSTAEFRAVKTYYDTVESPDKPLDNKKESADIADVNYNPPKTFVSVLKRVNNHTSVNYKEDKMTPSQKENLVRLMGYMSTNRFVYEMNMLKKVSERDNFEATFVRMCYDKPDLTEEEVEMYINYCAGRVSIDRMKIEEAGLIEWKEQVMREEKVPPMTIIEAINNTRSQIDSAQKRLEKSLQDLNGKRVNRLDKLAANNENVLKLIEAFREGRSRAKMIQYLELRKERRDKEVERITNMDELRAQIFGISPEEVS